MFYVNSAVFLCVSPWGLQITFLWWIPTCCTTSRLTFWLCIIHIVKEINIWSSQSFSGYFSPNNNFVFWVPARFSIWLKCTRTERQLAWLNKLHAWFAIAISERKQIQPLVLLGITLLNYCCLKLAFLWLTADVICIVIGKAPFCMFNAFGFDTGLLGSCINLLPWWEGKGNRLSFGMEQKAMDLGDTEALFQTVPCSTSFVDGFLACFHSFSICFSWLNAMFWEPDLAGHTDQLSLHQIVQCP